jgi:hypothetical protein
MNDAETRLGLEEAFEWERTQHSGQPLDEKADWKQAGPNWDGVSTATHNLSLAIKGKDKAEVTRMAKFILKEMSKKGPGFSR